MRQTQSATGSPDNLLQTVGSFSIALSSICPSLQANRFVMVGAFQKSAQESRKTAFDWLNKLAGEESLAQVAARLSSYTNSQQLADLLNPMD
jgi:hypothetical protein